MRIRATFANRTYEPEMIELVHAWDEYQIDENPEGYKDSLNRELDLLGADLLNSVTVEIEISTGTIEDVLFGRHDVIEAHSVEVVES